MTKVVELIEICKNLSLENMEDEIWKDVVGYEGLYQVSNMGRVKAMGRPILIIYPNRKDFFIQKKERIHKSYIGNTGYFRYELSKDAKQKIFSAHRLVMEAFHEKIDGKNYVNHKNGIKTDNRLENLEWCSQKENIRHAFNTGLSTSFGVNNANNKLKESDVLQIRCSKLLLRELSEIYKVSTTTISLIKRGKAWKRLK